MEAKENDNQEVAMDVDADQPKNSIGIDSDQDSVLASSSVIVAAINVSLHPLVIMNVSEHWTRIRAQEELPSKDIKIAGALIGKQQGRNIEIMNSFELKLDIVDKFPVIDMDYYEAKEQQFRQVFPDLEFLGWYTNGDVANKDDIKLHKQMLEVNESALFLKLNPLSRHTGLPIKIYESIIDMINGVPTMLFVDVPYTLATEEAERIVLDHMARITTSHSGDSANSVVAEHLRVQYSAVKMLRDRIKLILEFVGDMKNQTIPVNHEILREILNMCYRLPVISSDNFNEDFYIQCNDVTLITYLSTLTKCTSSMNQYANKFNVLLDRPGTVRRMRLY